MRIAAAWPMTGRRTGARASTQALALSCVLAATSSACRGDAATQASSRGVDPARVAPAGADASVDAERTDAADSPTGARASAGDAEIAAAPGTAAPGASPRPGAPGPIRLHVEDLPGAKAAYARDLAAPKVAPAPADAGLPGWLVFVSEREGAPAIYRMRPEGQDLSRMSQGTGADYPALALPGGDLVVVHVDEGERDEDHRERLDRMRMDPAGAVSPLAAASGRTRSPALGPAGAFLVYESDAASFRDLYRLDLDRAGAIPRRLTDDADGNFAPSVSADGRLIAFVSSRDGNAEIYVMEADGARPRRLTVEPGSDTEPSFAPTGDTIAFLSDRDGAERIYLMTSGGLAERPLTAGGLGLVAEGEITWSPDGAWIAWIGHDGRHTSLWVSPAAGGAARRLTDGRALEQSPAWSPTGTHLAFASDRDGDLEIHRIAADGSGLVQVSDHPAADWLPRWLAE